MQLEGQEPAVPKGVEKFVWTQGPFCSVFVSSQEGDASSNVSGLEWEVGKPSSPKVDVVLKGRKENLEIGKNKMNRKYMKREYPTEADNPTKQGRGDHC